MIRFFQTPLKTVIATEVDHTLSEQEIKELNWLYGEATMLEAEQLEGFFVGPRREMVTPWSTNAVEITQNMGLKGISRIEEYFPAASKDAEHDEMLQRMYNGLSQDIFTINIKPEPIKYVDNLEEYNEQEGLALSPEEIDYLSDNANKSKFSICTKRAVKSESDVFLERISTQLTRCLESTKKISSNIQQTSTQI